VKLANVVAELYPELRDTLRHAGEPLMNLILQQLSYRIVRYTLDIPRCRPSQVIVRPDKYG